MKSKLKIAALTVLTALCFVVGCLFAGCKIDYAALYNDEAKIITSNSHSAIASVEQKTLTQYTYSCSKFSGVMEIKSFTVESGLTWDVNLNVEAGDLKLVLTNSSKVYVLKEGSYEGALTFEDIPAGSYKLKMVGVGAEFKLTINY